MPGMDKMGPEGKGPMTGRGLGPCGRGLAFRRGFGRRMMARSVHRAQDISLTKEEQRKVLEAQKEEIEERLNELA